MDEVKWLTPMKLTELGEQRLVGNRTRGIKINNKKAVFIGYDRTHKFYKILIENSSSPGTYSPDFWKPIV